MESLLNPRQIAACQPEPVKAPGPPTIVDLANDISDDSTVSVMTGESVGQTAATHDSLATRSLEQVTATLQDPAQVVTTRVAPTAELPEGPVPPIIPVVASPRDTTKTWLVPILGLDPDNPPSGMTSPVLPPTPPPVIHAPVPRKAPGFPATTPTDMAPKAAKSAVNSDRSSKRPLIEEVADVPMTLTVASPAP